MGNFERSGTFKSRDKFVEGLKGRVGKLRQGALAVMKEEWKKEAGADVALLSGFGVKVRFEVKEKQYACRAELPVFLPIPQSKVEEMVDGLLKDLKDL